MRRVLNANRFIASLQLDAEQRAVLMGLVATVNLSYEAEISIPVSLALRRAGVG